MGHYIGYMGHFYFSPEPDNEYLSKEQIHEQILSWDLSIYHMESLDEKYMDDSCKSIPSIANAFYLLKVRTQMPSKIGP